MPVSRSAYKQCFCEKCVETSNCANDGTSKGVLITEHLMAAHLQCTKYVQAELAMLTHAASSDRTNDSADLIVSQLRTLTLAHNKLVSPHVPSCLEQPNSTPLVSISALADDLK